MPLEEAIKENTAAVHKLIAALEAQTGAKFVKGLPPKESETKKPESTNTSGKPEAGADSDPKSAPVVEKPDSPTEPTAGAGTLTLDDVADRVKRLVGQKSRDDAVALLTEFGVKKASELKQGQYADFIARAEEILKGE